eukprot:Sspe_Gene.35470::Locus_17175_Transcript_1_1_Confidence_1.000_Length_2418::g.35470::m.35470/K17914/KIF13; kinesin family member 13
MAAASPRPAGSPVSPTYASSRLEPTTHKGKTNRPVAGSRLLVAVRTRPHLPYDRLGRYTDGEGGLTQQCVWGDSELNVVETNDGKGKKKSWPFDYVFNAGQEEIYDCIGKQMLVEAFNGFNVCLFAYGQTASGKTYTVQGLPGAGVPPERWRPEDEGLVPRLCRDVFGVVQERLDRDETLSIKVIMSMVEIYNEKVRDLLPATPLPRGQEAPNLDIVSNAKRIEVKNLTQHTVISVDRVLHLLKQGNANRQVSETQMNALSSRSHTIMQLHIIQTYENPSPDKRDCEATISIVDLAGSERQDKTGAVGETLEESKKINHSLLMLGRALSSFSEGKQVAHVPLRDSKLTRLLSESFGGNSKTWMLATVPPTLYNWSETISTLNYASSAKNITNNARQNQLQRAMEMKELRVLNAKLEEALHAERRKSEKLELEIEMLKRENRELEINNDPTAIKQLKEEQEKIIMKSTNLKKDKTDLVSKLAVPNSARDVDYRLETARADTARLLEMRKQLEVGTMPSARPHYDADTSVYIGRAKVSLRNIIEQTPSYLTLPLTNETRVEGASETCLVVNIFPVDAQGHAVTKKPQAESDLLGQRIDFVVHIIGVKKVPEAYSKSVYCKYVYKWAEKDSYKTAEASGVSPCFDFKKRFAFSKMNAGLVDYFRSNNVITFEVIGERGTG